MRASTLPVVILLLGCPAQVRELPQARERTPVAQPTPDVDEADPRVLKEGEDLYAAQAVERNKDPEPDGVGKGSGKPDRSNGVCQLFAPKLPNPNCCPREHGFDAEAAQRACGFDLYLGESVQGSCGFFFQHKALGQPWLRSSFVEAPSPKAAADQQVTRLKGRHQAQDVKTMPVPGVKGAYWTRHDGLAWAYIPGWSRVRRLAWRDEFCNAAGIAKIIEGMVAAKEPGPRDRRLDLIPRARS